jgi:hypothetical protein
MNSHVLLQIAAEFRERAAVAVSDEDRTELLYLAGEYEAAACADFPHKIHPFSVKIPK